eukprot:scaffold147864_cov36-Prasinocladus_malaysianus.AAC.1
MSRSNSHPQFYRSVNERINNLSQLVLSSFNFIDDNVDCLMLTIKYSSRGSRGGWVRGSYLAWDDCWHWM